MMLLAALVDRGGRPAGVSPTVRLLPGEKQYGWFPADVAGDGRRVVAITDQRIMVGERQWSLRVLTEVLSEPADWAVTLRMRGRREPLTLSGPWVPWLGVVLCAELYSAAFPPEEATIPPVLPRGETVLPHRDGAPAAGETAFPRGGVGRLLPGPRMPARSVDPDLGLQGQRVVLPHPVHRGDRHPGAAV